MKKYLLATLGLIFSAAGLMAQSTIYSQTFGGSFNSWTTVDNTSGGTAGKWTHNANATIASPSYGSQTNGSPTAANGFAIMLSDGNTNAVNTDLISPAINCTGHTYVGLQFSQWLAVYSSATATVSISTDATNWTQIYDGLSASTFANPETVQFDISSYAANQATVYLKFNYQATNDLWWSVDDIKVLDLPALDVATLSVNGDDYIGISNFPITTTIQNQGGTVVNDVTLTYDIGGADVTTQTFHGLTLLPFATTSVTFTAKAPLTTVAANTINVTASAPNGGTDANSANDVATKVVTTLSHVPVKNVLVEEFSTAVCGYCPGGATRVSEIVAADAYAVPVTIHAGFYTDNMTTADDNTLAAAFTNAAPTACIDRILFPKQTQLAIGVSGMGSTANEWKDAVEARHPVTPPVSISASNTYDNTSRVLSVTVTANFYGPVTGNFRMNCYVVEDSVVGSGNGYDQHSYYHDSPTTLNPWLGEGTYISSGTYGIAGYVHNHVERKLLDGVWGVAGVIPATTADGGSYTKTYTFTLPAGYNDSHVSIVPFVYEYNSNYTSGKNEVLNVLSLPLNSADSNAAPVAVVVSGIQEPAKDGAIQVSLYPNPANDVVNLDYSVANTSKLSFEVYNVMGQLVSNIEESTFAKGDYQTRINTAKYQSGLYFVTVKNQSQVLQTLKFVINR
ncbi:MAG: hypothetical protein JWO06_626 [Bacteroidota bacterium]|nr:hypothetical protein [Bacteroidota bacterium]